MKASSRGSYIIIEMDNNQIQILTDLGWDGFFQKAFNALADTVIIPARIIAQHKSGYRIMTGSTELEAVVSGKLYFTSGEETYPAVGDWVAVMQPETGNLALIESVLPRKSQFSRLAAGGRERLTGGATNRQVIAANIDLAFIVSALDGGRGLNLRRLERYLTLTWNSGASPVLILNKTDLCTDLNSAVAEVESIAAGVPLITASALNNTGIEEIHSHLRKGITAVFIGQSGTGKSSIINSLFGRTMARTGAVRESDHTGHHTTTHRELFLLPEGGAVIDTPGIRELQLWADEDSLKDSFSDIAALAAGCQFSDCSHNSEPGCAVQIALAEGTLELERFQNYLKMQKELRYLNLRQNDKVRQDEKERWRKIAKIQKQYNQNRHR